MRPRVPVCNLVLGIEARMRDDAIDMLPTVAKPCLERQLFPHRQQTHRLVRGFLLSHGREHQRGRRSEVAKTYVRKKCPPGKLDPQNHVKGRPRRVDGQTTDDSSLKAGHRKSERAQALTK